MQSPPRTSKLSLLRFTSIQAPNADPLCRAICDYLGAVLSIPTQFVNDLTWQEREAELDSGDIQVGWICGLPYVWKADRQPPLARLLAAPVMAGSRYGGQPIYFSDIVVRQDSPFNNFLDLRGKTWAYNEPHSQSGYNITRYKLASMGEQRAYFSRVIAAGSHQRALEYVLSGFVDASAIDSTVLETELARDPGLSNCLRTIEVLGPSPIPPWVTTPSLPENLYSRLLHALLVMHQNPVGKEILTYGRMACFVAVNDRDYDPIRKMERLAASVEF
jgi:ABC-type phosphate/phosphonate transport system substrate-binding protein